MEAPDELRQTAQPSARELTDLPPELWESSICHLRSLREKSACTQLCKSLSPAAHAVFNDSVRFLKKGLLVTLRPCHSAQPESTPVESCELETFFTAGGDLLRTALTFGGPGHLCGYPRVRFNRTGSFQGKEDFQRRPWTRVLHEGAVLRVRLSAETREVLGDAAFEDIMLTAPKAGFWTCGDVVNARDAMQLELCESRGGHTAQRCTWQGTCG